MKYRSRWLFLTMAACALPLLAQAQWQMAYTARTVNLRAGPARDYPIVAIIPSGYQIALQGCLADYTWCDVLAGPSRGWIYAGNINYAYQNTYVPVLNYGPIIGIGVRGFVLDDYWGRHYHDRPWYGERQRWIHRRTVPAPPPRFNPPERHLPPSQRPQPIGPRPAQPQPPRSVVPRPQPPSPPRSVVPGQPPPPQPRIGPGPRVPPGASAHPQRGPEPAPLAHPPQAAGAGAVRQAPPQRAGADRHEPRGEGRARVGEARARPGAGPANVAPVRP
jgi:uncharacterized protein YraI